MTPCETVAREYDILCVAHNRDHNACQRERVRELEAEVRRLREALGLMMQWIGPPPADRHSFDSLREDAWKKAKAAMDSKDGGR